MLKAREGPSAIILSVGFLSFILQFLLVPLLSSVAIHVRVSASALKLNVATHSTIKPSLNNKAWKRSSLGEDILTIRGIIVDQIQIVRPKICASKRCSRWNRESSWSTSSKRCIEIWCNSQSWCVGIISRPGNCSPDNINRVRRLVHGICGLAHQIGRTLTSNIDLFYNVKAMNSSWEKHSKVFYLLCIVSRCNKNDVCISIVRQARHSYHCSQSTLIQAIHLSTSTIPYI